MVNISQSIFDLNEEIGGILDEINIGKLWFTSLYIIFSLSTRNIDFIGKLLASAKTRANLLSLSLKFNILSEWLKILALCADCIEIQHIKFEYLQSDLDNEQEAIEIASRELKKKIGVIDHFEIWKTFNSY